VIEKAINYISSLPKRVVFNMYKERQAPPFGSSSTSERLSKIANPFDPVRTLSEDLVSKDEDGEISQFYKKVISRQRKIAWAASIWGAIHSSILLAEGFLRTVTMSLDDLAKTTKLARSLYFLSKPIEITSKTLANTVGFFDKSFEMLGLWLKGRDDGQLAWNQVKKHLSSRYAIPAVLGLASGVLFGGLLPNVHPHALSALKQIFNPVDNFFGEQLASLAAVVGGEAVAIAIFAVGSYFAATALLNAGDAVARLFQKEKENSLILEEVTSPAEPNVVEKLNESDLDVTNPVEPVSPSPADSGQSSASVSPSCISEVPVEQGAVAPAPAMGVALQKSTSYGPAHWQRSKPSAPGPYAAESKDIPAEPALADYDELGITPPSASLLEWAHGNQRRVAPKQHSSYLGHDVVADDEFTLAPGNAA